jgi:hypothetical protein
VLSPRYLSFSPVLALPSSSDEPEDSFLILNQPVPVSPIRT